MIKKRVRLNTKELALMPPGSKFIVYWAKDNDENDVRLNDKIQEVASNTRKLSGNVIMTKDMYEWDTRKEVNPNDNRIDTDRGYAYFYKVQTKT